MKITRPTALILILSALFAVLTVGVFIGRRVNRRFLYAEEVQKLSERKSTQTAVNINTAPEKKIAALEGIGADLAERIVDYRERWGEFESVDELLSVRGFSRELLDALRDRLTVG